MATSLAPPEPKPGLGSGSVRWRPSLSRLGGTGGSLALYLLLSLLLFGLPIIGHPRGHIIAVDDQDPSFLMWMLAWWPHALLHGLNPLITHAIYYPEGYNLAWSTSMPLVAVLLAPVTLSAGPEVSWNVLELLCPALSAWTAFLLCRYLTRRRAAALAGGYLFGFSPYVLAAMRSAPNIAFVALLPVLVALVLRQLRGELSPRRFLLLAALALTAQFLISTEILATATLFGGVTLVVAFALLPRWRRRLRALAPWLAGAYALSAALLSPYLYEFFAGPHYPPGITLFQADLTAFFVPPEPLLLHVSSAGGLRGSDMLDYLGLPWLAIVALYCWRERRRRLTLVLLIALLVPVALSLGGVGLVVHGQRYPHVWLPWQLLDRVPLLRYAIPNRFSLFAMLPAAVMAALWLARARRPRWPAWGIAALAVAFIVPAAGSSNWSTAVSDPPFFRDGLYRHYLSARDHVFTIPEWGPSQRWVADAGFPFPLSAGSGGQGLPQSYLRYALWRNLLGPPYSLPADYAAELRQFLADKRVTAIVVWQSLGGPWKQLFGTLGVRPVAVGGVLVYRLRPA